MNIYLNEFMFRVSMYICAIGAIASLILAVIRVARNKRTANH